MSEVERRSKADALASNTFGIVHGGTSLDDKFVRLVALVPMALEVVDEARDTIQRLREENESIAAVHTLKRVGEYVEIDFPDATLKVVGDRAHWEQIGEQ